MPTWLAAVATAMALEVRPVPALHVMLIQLSIVACSERIAPVVIIPTTGMQVTMALTQLLAIKVEPIMEVHPAVIVTL